MGLESLSITLAKRLTKVQESATLKMAAATRAAAQTGRTIINFSVGEPHFPVPKEVQDAAINAIHEGFSKYTPVPGIIELRKRIVKKLQEENGLTYTHEQILVSAGAKQSLFNLMMAIISPGDEVLIPAPYWTSYPQIVNLAEGKPVILPTSEKNKFKLTPETLKAAITLRTKLLMLNSPSNPAGTVYTKEDLSALAKVLEGTQVLVSSDEIYEHLVFDGLKFHSFAAVSPDAFSRTITINSFSKAYAMTGWRLGYAAGPKTILDAMAVIQGQSTSGANSVTQKAAIVALDIAQEKMRKQRDELQKCRQVMVEVFSQYPKVSYAIPEGAFYLFLNISKFLGKKERTGETVADSESLALYLLKEAGVGTVPGSGFGEENYLRLSFASPEKIIQDGSRKIIEALEKLS